MFRHNREVGTARADGLHEEIWQRFCAIVIAASTGETRKFLQLWEAVQQEVADPRRRRWAVVYTKYVLEYRVHQILGRRPASHDLSDIAAEANADFACIIDTGKVSLYDVLCTVFEVPPRDRWVTGPEFGAAGSAAIGALLDNPARQLSAIRPHLAAWCTRYADILSEMGLG